MAVDRVREVVETEWAYLVGLLPADLEKLAAESGALRRRRAVGSAAELVRLALAYAVEDWSLRQTAAMARTLGWQPLSDVAVLKRLRGSAEFLRRVVSALLARRLTIGPRPATAVCLVDATTVRRPGDPATDWRLHVVYDLTALQLRAVQITDTRQGESLTRLTVPEDAIYVGDRAYGTTPGVRHWVEHGGTFITRTSLQQIQLEPVAGGGPVDRLAWLETLPEAQAGACMVGVRTDEFGVIPLRLVAVRKSPAAVAAAVQRAVSASQRHGHVVRADTVRMAAYVICLTNCTATITPEQVLEVYRFRWQIELAFKRLKSLLHLDHLRARDADLAQAYLLAKILAALLAEELTVQAALFSPWGFQLVPTPAEPLAGLALLV